MTVKANFKKYLLGFAIFKREKNNAHYDYYPPDLKIWCFSFQSFKISFSPFLGIKREHRAITHK